MKDQINLAAAVGRRVRNLRKARGLTQEQLGTAVGLDFKYLGTIERGEHAPSFDAVERIAQALGVRPHELFTPDGTVGGQLKDSLDVLSKNADRIDTEALQ